VRRGEEGRKEGRKEGRNSYISELILKRILIPLYICKIPCTEDTSVMGQSVNERALSDTRPCDVPETK